MNNLNPKISWSILMVVAIIALGSVGFYFYKYYVKDIVTNTTLTETPSVNPAVDEDTNTWKTYDTTAHTIKYPSSWEPVEIPPANEIIYSNVEFRPFESEENLHWTLMIYQKPASLAGGNTTTIDKIISGLGTEFADRKATTDKIEFNSIIATRAIITSLSTPEYYQVIILAEKDDKIYAIVNSKVKDNNFNSFYKSFKFK